MRKFNFDISNLTLGEVNTIIKELEEEASISLLKSDKNWNISDDETSFYFTLGYTLGSAPNYIRSVNDKEITN